MRSKSHLIIGTLAATEISVIFGIPITPLGILSSAFFSTAPDIDEANSNVLNKFISKNSTKKIYKILLYFLLILFFYLFIKTNDNLYFGFLVSVFLLNLIQKKLTENFIRSIVISSAFAFLALTMMLYNINFGIIALTIFLAIFPLLKHRGFTHSISMLVMIYVLLRYIEFTTSFKNISIVGTVSYSSHLLCDMITKRGIPLLYPISNKYYSIGKLKVGSFWGNFIEMVLIILLLIIVTFSFIVFNTKVTFIF